MAILVILEDYNGRVLRKVSDFDTLPQLLPGYEDYSFPYLSCIDPYGNTVFNRLQMRQFLEEWTRLKQKALREDDKDTATRIELVEGIALECQDAPDLYLKFVGD